MATNDEQGDEPEEAPLEARIGAAIGRTAGLAFRVPLSLLEQGGQLVGLFEHKTAVKPGGRPGLDLNADVPVSEDAHAPIVTVFDFDKAGFDERAVDDLDVFLREAAQPRAVRWINVAGLDLGVVTRLARAFGMHPLAAEDTMHVPQRPKADDFDDASFLVMRMLRIEASHLIDEQVSFFVKEGLVLTFQQIPGDVWDRVRKRIRTAGSQIRTHDAGHLAYALIDAIVDHCFPVLEHYGDRLEQLETQLYRESDPSLALRIHSVKRDLMLLRRVLWPLRELVGTLRDDEPPWMKSETYAYMKDVHDHVVRLLEMVEMFREAASGLGDLYLNQQSHKMNEIMKVLTMMASLFIPVTFIAGVYGMNFEHMPELSWQYGYYVVWGVFVVVTTGLLGMFRYKRWI